MCKRVHACVSHFTFIYLLLANLSKSESKRVSPKIIVGKFPILQINSAHNTFILSIQYVPVPTTRLSFLASDGTLLRLFSLNIACLRETKFWTTVGSIQTKDSLRDKIAFCLLPSIDIHSFIHSFIHFAISSPLCSCRSLHNQPKRAKHNTTFKEKYYRTNKISKDGRRI